MPNILGILWNSLNATEPSILLDTIRAKWRVAKPDDAPAIAAEVAAWQKSLWSFASVGLIGRKDGPKRWLEPVVPLATSQDFRFKIPESPDGSDVIVSLAATDAGDGSDGDFVVWKSPRLVIPGRPDILLRDLPAVIEKFKRDRHMLFANAAAALNAADEIAASTGPLDLEEVAHKFELDAAVLQSWLDYLGIGGHDSKQAVTLIDRMTAVGGYEFVNGWGTKDTPLALANSSDELVRIPGNLKPHSIAVHPSPALRIAVGWKSPISGTLRIEGAVAHAHPECGNGVAWSLELRRGTMRQQLAAGVVQGAGEAKLGPFDGVQTHVGDVVVLSIGPRDGNHSCDLTAIDVEINEESTAEKTKRTWNLAADVSGNILAGNPHADRLGNENVWHFFTEPESADAARPVIPAGSLLAKWRTAPSGDVKKALASEFQRLLTGGPPTAKDDPDAVLYRQLSSLTGPLASSAGGLQPPGGANSVGTASIGIDLLRFGHHPNGHAIEASDLCVRAPEILEIHVPAEVIVDGELVTSAVLDPESGAEGSVQVAVSAGRAPVVSGLVRSEASVTTKNGQWSNNNQNVGSSAPVLVTAGSQTERRFRRGV